MNELIMMRWGNQRVAKLQSIPEISHIVVKTTHVKQFDKIRRFSVPWEPFLTPKFLPYFLQIEFKGN